MKQREASTRRFIQNLYNPPTFFTTNLQAQETRNLAYYIPGEGSQEHKTPHTLSCRMGIPCSFYLSTKSNSQTSFHQTRVDSQPIFYTSSLSQLLSFFGINDPPFFFHGLNSYAPPLLLVAPLSRIGIFARSITRLSVSWSSCSQLVYTFCPLSTLFSPNPLLTLTFSLDIVRRPPFTLYLPRSPSSPVLPVLPVLLVLPPPVLSLPSTTTPCVLR
jgi:hypothetical protein